MKRYVAIVKRVKDLEHKHALKDMFHATYPAQVKEFIAHSREHAEQQHPGATILTNEEYFGYKLAYQHMHEHVEQKTAHWFKRLFGVK